jgi:lysozyme
MDRNKVAELITIHEGKKNVAYRDTRNKLTVGIGFNLMRPGAYSIIESLDLNYDDVCSGKCKLDEAHIDIMFQIDLSNAIEDTVDCVHNFMMLPDDVQMALVDMMFNLGYGKFIKFRKLIAALEQLDYCTAVDEMLDSQWATQVPHRAKADSELVKQFCHKQ